MINLYYVHTKFSIIHMHISIWTFLASLVTIIPCYFPFLIYLCVCLFAYEIVLY